MQTAKIHLIAAARPNFMKIAPLFHELSGQAWASVAIVHTGQHYDPNMSDGFFRDLRLPEPAVNLGVGSGSHAEQLAGVMIAYERYCRVQRPDVVIVVGDVNSTAACAIVGAQLGIPVVHLEAGLRSGDRGMPEEINRVLTDSIADVLWTPSRDADANLQDEGVEAEKITCIGNIMIDSFEMLREEIEGSEVRENHDLMHDDYALVTLHRPSNVDEENTLARLVEAIIDMSQTIRTVFVAHPRTRKALEKFRLLQKLESRKPILVLEPQPYIPFMGLLTGSRLVVTDSGGLQEETTYLGIPCLTLRENTERPITISEGTNRLVSVESLREHMLDATGGRWPDGRKPELWDGRAAQRASADLARRLNVSN